jgi:hypothetical protein
MIAPAHAASDAVLADSAFAKRWQVGTGAHAP